MSVLNCTKFKNPLWTATGTSWSLLEMLTLLNFHCRLPDFSPYESNPSIGLLYMGYKSNLWELSFLLILLSGRRNTLIPLIDTFPPGNGMVPATSSYCHCWLHTHVHTRSIYVQIYTLEEAAQVATNPVRSNLKSFAMLLCREKIWQTLSGY